jgi:hypothetical protein
MLLRINARSLFVEKHRGYKLRDVGLDERKLQDILFRSLDRLFADDELILLMQSRRGQRSLITWQFIKLEVSIFLN